MLVHLSLLALLLSLSPVLPYKGASDLLQFSVDAFNNLHKKMDIDGQFSDFREAFQNIQVHDKCENLSLCEPQLILETLELHLHAMT